MTVTKQDVDEMLALCSRLKMRGLHMKALGDPFQAARYIRAAAVLEDNPVERHCLEAEAALLELRVLEEGRKDLALSIRHARKKLLDAHT